MRSNHKPGLSGQLEHKNSFKYCGIPLYNLIVELIFTKTLQSQNGGLIKTTVGKTSSKILSHKDEQKTVTPFRK